MKKSRGWYRALRVILRAHKNGGIDELEAERQFVSLMESRSKPKYIYYNWGTRMSIYDIKSICEEHSYDFVVMEHYKVSWWDIKKTGTRAIFKKYKR